MAGTEPGGSRHFGHGMSADHRLKTAATHSTIWDGQFAKRVRAGDGVTIQEVRCGTVEGLGLDLVNPNP